MRDRVLIRRRFLSLLLGLSVSLRNVASKLLAADPLVMTEDEALAYGRAVVALSGPQRPTPDVPQRLTRMITRKRHVVYIGSPGCSPCRRVQSETFPVLRQSGWIIQESTGGHVWIIQQGDPLATALAPEQLPTWVLIENGHELRRTTGFLSPREFTDWYYRSDEASVEQGLTPRSVVRLTWHYWDGQGRRDEPTALRQHLIHSHGLSAADVRGLSPAELIARHSRAHGSR